MGSRKTNFENAAAQAPSSVANALFTRTQQRLLALFFGNTGRSFFKQELINRTGSGSGGVQRELARLIESGLVTVTRIGSQKHYQANRSAPIFEELRRIVTKTVGLIDPLRAALRPLAKRIDLAFVYGSIARGEDRVESDIDLLVVASDLTLEDLFKRLAPAERMLGRKINPTLYTPDELARRRKNGSPFLKKVLGGETIVVIGTEDDVVQPR